jgi:hypothetical protein
MKVDAHRAQQHQGQSNVHKLITPEMRQQVVQLKEQLEDYVGRLDTVCRNVDVINDAIYRAYEIAECLLKDDPFDAWEVIQGEKQPAGYMQTEEPDWVPDTFD